MSFESKRVLVDQSCLTLCDPVVNSSPASSVHGILQARILEWVANPFPRGSSWPRSWIWVSCIAGRFFTIWAILEAPYTIPKLYWLFINQFLGILKCTSFPNILSISACQKSVTLIIMLVMVLKDWKQNGCQPQRISIIGGYFVSTSSLIMEAPVF